MISDQRAIIYSEDDFFLLKGKLCALVAPLLCDSGQTLPEMQKKLAGYASPKAVEQLLYQLIDSGYVVAEDGARNENETFWHSLGVNLNYAKQQLSIKTIHIQSTSNIDTSLLRSTLTQMDVRIADANQFLDILVVDDYLHPLVYKHARDSSRPWILVKPVGRIVWFGPLFLPGTNACFDCLRRRLLENRRVEVDLFGTALEKHVRGDKVYSPANLSLVYGLVANEIVKWLVSDKCLGPSQEVYTLDTGALAFRSHFVHKLECCSASKSLVATPPTLKTCPKAYYSFEGERSMTIEATLSRLEPLISPITGIIKQIKHHEIAGTHICYAMLNHPLSTSEWQNNNFGYFRIPEVVTGKGSTQQLARLGCLAEAVERYSCTFSAYDKTIIASPSQVKSNFIQPQKLLQFSEAQYRDRETWNLRWGPQNQVPERVDELKPLHWTPAWSLSSKQFRYLPTSFCYLSHPFENERAVCPGDSNGLASGTRIEEALYYGLLEVIERDAVAIWWYNQTKRFAVDLSSFEIQQLKNSQRAASELRRSLQVIDITTDIGIPTFVAISCDEMGRGICLGSAAHLNPVIAIIRAIDEQRQVQSHLLQTNPSELKVLSSRNRDLVNWLSKAHIDDHPHCIADNSDMLKANSYQPVSDSNDFLRDVSACVELLAKCDLEALFVNLSRTDTGLSTVKIVVPGLCHFWARLGAKRLYDVPVLQRLQMQPKDEGELNQIPYFL